MRLYAGIDLHSNNHYVVVIDAEDRIVFRGREANYPEAVLRSLAPFRTELVGVVVESTYNCYWLVDALQPADYVVHLANPAGIVTYAGLKRSNDWTDAQWLAHLLRVGLLAEGYIYPSTLRPTRDLLRKRHKLVGQRTLQVQQVETVVSQYRGLQLSRNQVLRLDCPTVEQRFQPAELALLLTSSLRVLAALEQEIERIEKRVTEQVRWDPSWDRLLTVWGVGRILALTILLETGSVSRFPTVGQYCSYCRLVDSPRESNGKRKGSNNAKAGNRYLAWAFVEAAQAAARFYPSARAFLQRKQARGGPRILALKALAHKLCRASYYVLRDGVAFEAEKLFGLGAASLKTRMAPQPEF